jgi:hypothetical protein
VEELSAVVIGPGGIFLNNPLGCVPTGIRIAEDEGVDEVSTAHALPLLIGQVRSGGILPSGKR